MRVFCFTAKCHTSVILQSSIDGPVPTRTWGEAANKLLIHFGPVAQLRVVRHGALVPAQP